MGTGMLGRRALHVIPLKVPSEDLIVGSGLLFLLDSLSTHGRWASCVTAILDSVWIHKRGALHVMLSGLRLSNNPHKSAPEAHAWA